MALANSLTQMAKSMKVTLRITKKKAKEREINRLIYPNGKIYKGEFSNDKPHGHGVITHSNGTTLTGVWNMGKMERVDDSEQQA